MEREYKCWKTADEGDTAGEVLIVDGKTYTHKAATELEIDNGGRCLAVLYVERKYKTQVCGPDHPRPYYDMRSEVHELRFEELIFNDDEICIGVYHEGLTFIIERTETHYQEKYLGEMPTGPDQAIEFYDYYYLRLR